MERKILQMIGTLGIGGSQAFIMNIYRNIDRTKFQFDFIVDHPELNYYVPEIEELGGKVYYFPTFKGSNISEVIVAWNTFFKEHIEYDVIHCHVRSYASIYIPIAKKYGLKTIIHSHSDSNGKGLVARIKNILQIPLRYQADFYMACSVEAGQWLFGKWVCSTERFLVVKNGIDSSRFVFMNDTRRKLRDEFEIGDSFVIGFIARVTEAKNPVFVLKIFKEYLKYDNEAILLFVGDGELLSETKKQSKVMGIDKNIIFTGARSDVNELLCAMDYYVLASKWEGFGISLVEAQASGIMCICSEAIHDEAIIVTDRVNRLKISENEKKWSATIRATQNYDRRDEQNKICNAGFDVTQTCRTVLEIYEELIDSIYKNGKE